MNHYRTSTLLFLTMLIAVLSSCSSTDTTAPTPAGKYSVKGTISTTDTKETVKDIDVSLGTLSTKTDSVGGFVFDSVGTGTYQLIPTKANRVFAPTSRTIEIKEADVVAQDFVLSNPNPIPEDSIEYVLILPGTFVRGVDSAYVSSDPLTNFETCVPKQQVTLTKAYYMSKYEITQAQYLAVMGENPSRFQGARMPVHSLNYQSAARYCNKLSRLHGFDVVYTIDSVTPTTTRVKVNLNANGYRMPTDAEWEYAAAAGDTTIYYGIEDFPPNPSTEQIMAVEEQTKRYAWSEHNSSVGGVNQPHDVGLLEPNRWGLYDMIGNIHEYTSEHGQAYDTVPVVDPFYNKEVGFISSRGGRYAYSGPRTLNLRYRWFVNPNDNSPAHGIRLVRTR